MKAQAIREIVNAGKMSGGFCIRAISLWQVWLAIARGDDGAGPATPLPAPAVDRTQYTVCSFIFSV